MSDSPDASPRAAPAAGPEPDRDERRRRGRRPADAAERRGRVEQALRELEGARVPFTMGDLAERAGISRATLYRDAGLRDIVGARGDSPDARPVDWRAYQDLQTRAQTLALELRTAKRALRRTEKELRETQEAAYQAEKRAREDARRARAEGLSGADADRITKQAYAEGFAAGARVVGGGRRSTAGGPGGANTRPEANLAAAAARLAPAKLLAARRQLARALHPDLFAQDPAAALLATELLKQINGLASDAAAKNGDKR
jgi:hypothetical protein